MNPFRKHSPGHTAMMIMFIVLILTVCAALYLFLERRLSPATARLATGELSAESVQAELSLLLLITLGAVLLILIFIVGAYLFIRTGRLVSHKRVGGKPTDYVDVWSSYRLSEDQIDAATEEEHPGSQDQTEPDDEPPADSPEGPNPAS